MKKIKLSTLEVGKSRVEELYLEMVQAFTKWVDSPFGRLERYEAWDAYVSCRDQYEKLYNYVKRMSLN